MRFSDSTLLTRAAVAGQGLGLLRDTYVADDIAVGRLQVAIDAPWPADFAYYVVTRRGSPGRHRHVANFKKSLCQEAEADA